MRIHSILIFISLVFGCIAPTSSYAAHPVTEGITSDSTLPEFRNSGKIVYSSETYAGIQNFSRGHADKAYAIWVEEAWNGDIDAAALVGMTCLMEERSRSPEWKVQWGKPRETAPICPVPAKFWEDALVKILGEGEGTLLLGLFGMELMENDPYRKEIAYAAPIEAFMLRSAMAGNTNGMYGAFYTAESENRRFSPPKSMPSIPIVSEKYIPHPFESRFWLSHAAHAGNFFSLEILAMGYRGGLTKVSPDFERAEKYYISAVEGGSSITSHLLSILYMKGEIFAQSPQKAIYYLAIAALLEENGELIADNKQTNPLGYALNIMKEGFIEGELHYRGHRYVFEPCLSEAEYQEVVVSALPLYERAKAAGEKEQAAHDALYNAARAMLPGIQAEYQKRVHADKK